MYQSLFYSAVCVLVTSPIAQVVTGAIQVKSFIECVPMVAVPAAQARLLSGSGTRLVAVNNV